MQCRLYLDAALEINALVDIDAEQTKYLRQVMRLQAGDEITVFNGQGGEFSAEIRVLSKNSGQCVLRAFHDVNRELPCRVHIIQAANRSEKIETVLQKATEMGAFDFQIVNSERATFHLPSNKREKRLQRWQKIVTEAAEQSERTAMPSVTWVDKLHNIKLNGSLNSKGFILHPRDAMLWQSVRDNIVGLEDITIAIGPEGGWTNQELEVMYNKGFVGLAFGQRIMRTETAAPALLAAIQAVV